MQTEIRNVQNGYGVLGCLVLDDQIASVSIISRDLELLPKYLHLLDPKPTS